MNNVSLRRCPFHVLKIWFVWGRGCYYYIQQPVSGSIACTAVLDTDELRGNAKMAAKTANFAGWVALSHNH